MDKEQREFELKKIEIEKLKTEVERLTLLVGLSRTLAILLIPLVAGIITLIYKIYGDTKGINQGLLIFGVVLSGIIFIYFVWLNNEILNKEKEIKKKLRL